jgi:hypothetical protein
MHIKANKYPDYIAHGKGKYGLFTLEALEAAYNAGHSIRSVKADSSTGRDNCTSEREVLVCNRQNTSVICTGYALRIKNSTTLYNLNVSFGRHGLTSNSKHDLIQKKISPAFNHFQFGSLFTDIFCFVIQHFYRDLGILLQNSIDAGQQIFFKRILATLHIALVAQS